MIEKLPKLLTQNSELRKNDIWCWTLPAFVVKRPNGENFNVCPNAGACAGLCYARQGTFMFPAVRAAHMAKLELVLQDLEAFKAQMIAEITSKRRIPYLRIHDAGDFFSLDYLRAWVEIAKACPSTIFYAYTKEVAMFKEFASSEGFPENFRYLFSMGGKQDNRIDREQDRHAEVFPSLEALLAAGYMDQQESDLLAITLPTNKIGIVINNHPHLKKRVGDRTFGGIQLEQYARKRPTAVSD